MVACLHDAGLVYMEGNADALPQMAQPGNLKALQHAILLCPQRWPFHDAAARTPLS